MHVCHNFSIVPTENANLHFSERNALYGDGLFETLLVLNGKIRWAEDHFDRLSRGLAWLDMALPPEADLIFFIQTCQKLWELNQKPVLAKAKWMVWRAQGGLYTPFSSQTHFILSLEPTIVHVDPVHTWGFSIETVLPSWGFDGLKTMNSLYYIRAGIEKKTRGWEEIILLNEKEEIVEALSSNIWGYKDNQWVIPSPTSGGVSGITSLHFKKFLSKNQISWSESVLKKDNLTQLDFCCLTNVMGIRVLELPNKQNQQKPIEINQFIEENFSYQNR